ncbi:hypothetical protein GALMADRAFT_712834 [Galerina marginata CBS 339.88]|uniref:F-box domain-containing protein n=1 Tax=Galerina marginata (strain CBS 339.88) TaxID=685588 RepID=A0A067TZC1_GALM3|nr:hypothetical protein GALMADRAFT_712834 [Galerina marginata CBS 339.88]
MTMEQLSPCPSCGNPYGRGVLLRNLDDTSAPFDHTAAFSHLRSGYIPTNEEKAPMLSTIQKQTAKLRLVNEELGRMKSLVDQLEARRSDLELQISYQSGLLAPIRQLPDELLVEIMLFWSRGKVDVCSPKSDVWNIEKVCKRWRSIATSTQEIWSSIDVFLGSLTPYTDTGISVEVATRLLSRCLQRSGHHALSVRFLEIGSSSLFTKTFKLLSAFSHRWERLSFSLSLIQGSPNLENGLTTLRYLSLSGSYKGLDRLHSFRHAQLLSQLHLFSVTKPFRSLVLPWLQLTRFKSAFCEFRTGEFFEILRHMPNLVEFSSKWNRGLSKTDANYLQPIHFRSLRSFEIEASASELPIILQPLTMPSLSDLYIHTEQSTTTSLYIHLANFTVNAIRRSLCAITTLSLFFVNPACISIILEAVPTLKFLYLGYITGVETIIRSLSKSESLVPNLENFSLTCKPNQGMFSVGPLVELVKVRRRRFSECFRSLDLTLKEEKGVGAIAEVLKPLSNDYGIAIVIHALPV